MEKKLLFAVWLACLGVGLQAGDAWQDPVQLQKIATGAIHYLHSTAQRALYQPPVIDKEWRVKNDTPYTIVINGNPVEPGKVLIGTGRAHKDADLVIAKSKHFQATTIDLIKNDSKEWTRYVAVTLKPGLMWGLRVGQRIAVYTDADIKEMVSKHRVLQKEQELTEWQITNRSSYDLTVDGVPLAKGGRMDGKLADGSLIRVSAEQLERWGFGPLDIKLNDYKGLLLRQRDQWLKIDIINKSLFAAGIDYRVSRELHFALFGAYGYLTTGWGPRWPRDIFLTIGAMALIHDRLNRFWRIGRKQ